MSSLRMLQFGAETSFRWLSEQGERDRSEAAEAHGELLELSVELKVTKAEVALLCEQVISPHTREVESLAKLKATKVEVTLLCEQVVGLEAREAELLIKIEADAFRQREEFKHSYYACCGFMKALSEVAILYSELDLSSLYRSS
ncbi:hypothetical protein ACLOJK_028340 [Asimina triloba]